MSPKSDSKYAVALLPSCFCVAQGNIISYFAGYLMRTLSIGEAGRKLICASLLCLSLLDPHAIRAAGVTLITHGFESPAAFPTWVSAMADEIPGYYQRRFPGLDTNETRYRVTVTHSGSSYVFTSTRTNGSAPFAGGTGEIIVELDWSSLSGDIFDSYASTSNVAPAVAQWLTLSNAIAELNGHALAEFPIHLIGHSRGGSLVSQISFALGTNGVWVDHVTTLDPYPFNNDGNSDPVFYTDATAKHTYVNVLFADNYWQNLGAGYLAGDPDGEPVSGAYVRQLTDLTGGYGSDHSNVHLWYHGTIDFDAVASDGGASIGSTERQTWYVPYEQEGVVAGFYYSLIGGGNRLSPDRPLGLQGDPAIVDGYNQNWDLGAGTKANRTGLPANSGTWPNIIKFDVIGTNTVIAGNPISTKLYYQYGGLSNLTAHIYFDQDFNPYNSNSVSVLSLQPPATGTNSVSFYSNLGLPTTNVTSGIYAIYATISDGKHTRYLYAPELVQITSSLQPPVLVITKSAGTKFVITVEGISGQTIVLQSSTDLHTWLSLATNTLATGSWNYTNSATNFSEQFYRGVLIR